MSKVKNSISILLCCLSFGILISGCHSNRSDTSKVKDEKNQLPNSENESVVLILDTDISGDYDDVGAMAVLHALADMGEAQILGVVASNQSPLVAPTIEVINTYFGRKDLPIGAPKKSGTSRDSRNLQWPHILMAKFPHTIESNDDVPGSVQVYRELLSKQPDTSVTIVTIGYLTNMKNLLESTADSISNLNGKELVAKKVKKWVAMAGNFETGKEANVRKDQMASHYAISHWPTPVVFSGFEIGKDVITGKDLIRSDEKTPITIPYEEGMSLRAVDRKGRPSWDQTAVLAAVRGFEPYFTTRKGKFTASKEGVSSWEDDPEGTHIRLVRKMEVGALTKEIEALMMHKPIRNNN